MLARRELSEAQVRDRLARREFESDAIDAAVTRLQADRALDDRRTALACARTEAHVKRHGRLRALRTVEALGIDRGLARDAVAEVFSEIDEDALIAQTLDRKLRHQPSPKASARQAPPSREASAGRAGAAEAAVARRLYRYLLARGFDAGRVHAAIRTRVKNTLHDE